MKNQTKILVGKLNLSEILEKSWIHLIVEFTMKLQLVAGKNVILVVYNKLLKMIHFVATTKGILIEELVRLFRDNV